VAIPTAPVAQGRDEAGSVDLRQYGHDRQFRGGEPEV